MDDNIEYSNELKIPKDRIAVLIGKNGEIKKEIESATNTNLDVDSKEGLILVKSSDSLGIFSASEIIKAIARGFNPEVAMRLLKQDYCFELIDINEFSGKSKKKTYRLKGRVIGEEGKSRKTIESLTETNIIVYGKTIGIIGNPNNVVLARKAIESILSGVNHASVYRSLERKRKELKRQDFEQPILEEKDE